MPTTNPEVLAEEQRLEKARTTLSYVELDAQRLARMVVADKYTLSELHKEKIDITQKNKVLKTEGQSLLELRIEEDRKLKESKKKYEELKSEIQKETEEHTEKQKTQKEREDAVVSRENSLSAAEEKHKEERKKHEDNVILYNENIKKVKEIVDLCQQLLG